MEVPYVLALRSNGRLSRYSLDVWRDWTDETGKKHAAILVAREWVNGVGTDWEWVEVDPFSDNWRVRDGSFPMSEKAMQRLVDDLWECGVRPAASGGSVGALSASQAHIEDLRKIAFKVVGVS